MAGEFTIVVYNAEGNGDKHSTTPTEQLPNYNHLLVASTDFAWMTHETCGDVGGASEAFEPYTRQRVFGSV